MSFAEFTYPLLQAWDWWELFKKGVQIQIGGADQFGNILAGVEAIKGMKKIEPVHFESDAVFHAPKSNVPLPKFPNNAESNNDETNQPIGFTVPLLTTSAGVKFGKSAGNAIWLDKEMTSSFELYQFFLRSADADVERYLKLFTFLPMHHIKAIMEEHGLDESKRLAQHKVAFECVELVHGLGAAQDAQSQHRKLFARNPSIDSLREDMSPATSPLEMEEKKARVPGDWNPSLNKYAKPTGMDNAGPVHIKLPKSLVVGQSFNRVLWSAGLVSSKAEGQRLIANKGCHVGSTIKGAVAVEMSDSLSFTPIRNQPNFTADDLLIDGDLLILRVGKWKMKIVNVLSDEEYEKSGLTCPGWKEGDDAEDYDAGEKLGRETIEFRTEKNHLKRQANLRKRNNRTPPRTTRWSRKGETSCSAS